MRKIQHELSSLGALFKLVTSQLSAHPLGSTGSALVFIGTYLVWYRVLLALRFISIVRISMLVAFYKGCCQQVLYNARVQKQYELITKKNLGNALPVVSKIKVMLV
jgi:hypothetical protein